MHYLSTCITPLSGYPTCPPLLKRPSLTEIQSSSLNFSLIIIIPYPIWPPYLCKGDKLKHKSGIAVQSFILSPRNRYAPPLTCFTELTPRKLRQRLKWKNFDGGLGERTTLMISQQSYPRCDGWEIYAQAVAHVDTRVCARDLEPPPCWRQLRIQFAKYSTQEFNWIFCGFATFLKRIRQRVFRGKNFWDFYILSFQGVSLELFWIFESVKQNMHQSDCDIHIDASPVLEICQNTWSSPVRLRHFMRSICVKFGNLICLWHAIWDYS